MNLMIFYLIFNKEKDDLVEYSTFIVLIIGLLFGSFLNMLIYRLPLGISLLNPKRSICIKCNYTLKWYENIPILSYILLKGKCSKCHCKISLQYPIVEILTALVSVSLYIHIGFTEDFYFIILIFYILILLSFIDYAYKAVPDYLLVLLVFITLLYLFLYKFENISIFFIFAGGIFILDLFVSFYIQNIKSKLFNNHFLKTQKSLGEGDIPIIAVIGGLLGLHFGLTAIFLSAIFAIIPAILNLMLRKEIETPFIPYLSLALFIVFINQTNIEKLLEGLQLV